LGVLCGPEVAGLAHASGVGSVIRAALGAKSGLPDIVPVDALWRVQALSGGRIPYSGEMYGGVTAEIGPSCLLRLHEHSAEIQVVVSSCRTQCLDQALFCHFGVDLTRQKIIVLKSTVHFRADFEPLASVIINAAATGAFVCDLSALDYQNLRSGVRQGPLGTPFVRRV